MKFEIDGGGGQKNISRRIFHADSEICIDILVLTSKMLNIKFLVFRSHVQAHFRQVP